mmetsp:Transcript_34873/g.75576  ORF Transcript_34873/g.75576 Transcript_34873/m.75576 type:complete len:280 (+) Transcript_34873:523-1362(+)
MRSNTYEDPLVSGGRFSSWGDDEEAAQPGDGQRHLIGMMTRNPIIFIWFVVAVLSASMSAIYMLKFYLEQRFGITCCTDHAAIRAAERRRNAAISAQQQKEIGDEKRRKALERSKRILHEFSLIVEPDYLEDEKQDLETLEAGLCSDSDERDSVVVLNIPGLRRTEGHCAICIAEYSPGDKVVWSPNDECRHVFHEDCILSWLGNDKKDCPCCRMPFIPEKEELDDENEEKREAAYFGRTSETQASLDTDGSESSFGSEEEPVPSLTSSSSNQAQQQEA